ncbi:MAG: choice-of-anchor Q domain-containing protein [Chloroflexota bacterium]
MKQLDKPKPRSGQRPISTRLSLEIGLLLVILILLAALLVKPASGAGTVGSGTPASCTEAALNTALSGGGSVSFNCGGSHTITLTSPKTISSNTTLNGGGQITLSGGDAVRLFSLQNGASLTLQNITLRDGFSSGNGGAIYVERLSTLTLTNSAINSSTAANGGAIALNGWGSSDAGGTLIVTNSSFSGNQSTANAIPGGGNGGGALYITGGSTATVSGSTFTSNSSVNGGGIHILGANLTVTGSTFTGNVANNTAGGGGGGAIYVDGTKNFNGTIDISLSTFTNNQSNQLGGAIFTFPEGSGSVLIDQSLFEGNSATGAGQGGAIYHQSATSNGPLSISNSTFMNNNAHATDGSASSGGALWLLDAPVTITSSTFSGNDATTPLALAADDWRRGFGGAIRTSDATTIVNSTLVNNTAGFVGGAVAGPATVRNSIIAHNDGDNPWDIQENCTVTLTNGGNNIQFPQKTTGNWNDYECFAGQTAVNPQLGSLGDYGGPTPTVPLLASSPAINAGSSCPTTDQRGFARNGICDIGAYEFGGGLLINSLAPPWSGLNDVQDVTLTVNGAGFTPSTVVRWNGANRATTYVSPFVVTGVLPAADLGTLGSYTITVYDPNRSLESDPVSFTVVSVLHETFLPMVIRP